MLRKISFFSTLLLLMWLVSGCSSEKKTFVSRNFHTFVSYFNGYYHAQKLYNEGVSKLDADVVVPEDGFLPLIHEGGGGAGQFDKAIEKCDVIIFRHKNGRWVDDSYFLKGKCSYFKGNYYDALLAFEYVMGKFKDTDLDAEIKLWMARCHFVLKNKYRTQQLLTEIGANADLSRISRVELAELRCASAIRMEDYNEAIIALEQSMPLVKKKLRKAKWNFLLAQLYQKIDGFDKAKQHYVSTLKLNANNELNFRSKLNIAQLYIDNAKLTHADVAEITKPLDKLLKDAKYEEYKDLIYYRLAQIEHKFKNTDKALGYYKESIEKNGGRQGLLALSNYEVGKIYFYEKQDLDSAQKYFDGAAAAIPPEYSEAYNIQSLAQSLRKYKRNREIIHFQDSVLALSNMPEKELEARIKEIVENEEKDKAEAKRKEEMQAMQQQGQMNQELFNLQQEGQNLVQGSGFYFDNPTQVTQGKAAFQRIWGIRKLEDNWRRRNKAMNAFTDADDGANIIADDPNDPVNGIEARKKRYFESVPRTKEDIKRSEDKLLSAMYELAQLYGQKLEQPDSAIKTYQRVIKRFPDSDYVPKSHYAIHTIATDRGNRGAADHHKGIILKQFPNSLYAKLLRKEETEVNSEATGNDFKTAYRTLYGLYAAGDYETVVTFSEFLVENHLDNEEIAKVYYMKGLSYGNLDKVDSMVAVYEFMKKSFPEDEATRVADKTLKLLAQNNKAGGTGKAGAGQGGKGGTGGSSGTGSAGGENGSGGAGAAKTDPNSPFRDFVPFVEKDPVIVLLIIDPNRMKKDDLQVKLAKFHNASYRSSNLTTQVYQYKDKKGTPSHMAYVSSFDTPMAGNIYVKTLLEADPEIAQAFTDPATQAMFISSTNFRTAFSQKRLDDYGKYFLNFRDKMLGK